MGANINVHRRLGDGARRAAAARRDGDGDRPARLGLAGPRRPRRRGRHDVNRVYHLDRGYERLEEKLAACGAEIERLKALSAVDDDAEAAALRMPTISR